MIPQADRLLALCTRPLAANPELQRAAQADLSAHISDSRPSPDQLMAAADTLERADSRPGRHRWRTALFVLALLVSLPAIWHTVHQLRVLAGLSFLSPTFSGDPPKLPAPASRLSPADRLLLHGDPSATSRADRWKPLWESDPENPAYLAQYATTYHTERKNLPPEILAAASRIDPDNALYSTLSAATASADAVVKPRRSYQQVKDNVILPYEIKDPSALETSLALIHQAAEKQNFATWQNELLIRRIPLLPPRTDFASQFPAMVHILAQDCGTIHLRTLADTLSAGAQQCAARGDSDGFQRITADWLKLSRLLAENGDTLIDLLVAKVFFVAPLDHFQRAAAALGLDSEGERYATLAASAKAEKDARSKPRNSNQDSIRKLSSMHAGLSIPMIARQVQSPPPLTDADFKPGRYTDHAFFARAASLAAWAVLGFCCVLLQIRRSNPTANLLSARTADLLHRADWLWIIGGGVIIPLLWHLAVTRLSPIASRETSLSWTAFIMPSCEFGGLLVTALVFPTFIASRRLSKRAACLGLAPRRRWTGWLATACAFLSIPAAGTMMLFPSAISFTAIQVLLGIPLVWLISGFIRGLFGRPEHFLRRATLAHIILPAWLLGMIAFTISMPLHHAEERHWIRQDTLLRISPDKPGLRYEYDVTQVLRAELLAMVRSAEPQ